MTTDYKTISRDRHTQIRADVASAFLSGKMDAEILRQTASHLKAALPTLAQDIGQELIKIEHAVQTGSASTPPTLEPPALATLWGAGLALLATKGMPDKTPLWQQITHHPVLENERAECCYELYRSFRKIGFGDFKVTLNPPPSPYPAVGYYCDVDNKVVNLDPLWMLIIGVERARAGMMHEVAHALGTKDFTPNMQALRTDMAEIKENKEASAENYLRLLGMNVEWHHRFYLWDECENSYANRFVVNKGLASAEDFGGSMNYAESVINGIANGTAAIKTPPPVPTDEMLFTNLKRAIRYSFFKNNDFFPDTPQGWRAIGVEPDWIASKTETGAVALKELCVQCQKLEDLQPQAADMLYGGEYFDAKNTEYWQERVKIMDEIYETFAEDIVTRIALKNQEEAKKLLEKQREPEKDNRKKDSPDKNETQEEEAQDQEQSSSCESGQCQSGKSGKSDSDNSTGKKTDKSNGSDEEPSGAPQEKPESEEASEPTPTSEPHPAEPTSASPEEEPQEPENASKDPEAAITDESEPQSAPQDEDAPSEPTASQPIQEKEEEDTSTDNETAALTEGEEKADKTEPQSSLPDIPLPPKSPKEASEAPPEESASSENDAPPNGTTVNDAIDGKANKTATEQQEKTSSVQETQPQQPAPPPQGEQPKTLPSGETVNMSEYEKLVVPYQSEIQTLAKTMTRMKDAQQIQRKTSSPKRSLVPIDGSPSRLDSSKLEKTINKIYNGQSLHISDFKTYKLDGKTSSSIPEIDIEVLIDISGSMTGEPFERTLQTACLLHESGKKAGGVNVNITALGQPVPTPIARKGETHEEISRNILLVRSIMGGWQDLLSPALHDIAVRNQSRRDIQDKPAGKTHIIVVSDGFFSDRAIALDATSLVAKNCKQTTMDFLILDNPQRVSPEIEQHVRNLNTSNPQGFIGYEKIATSGHIQQALISLVEHRLRALRIQEAASGNEKIKEYASVSKALGGYKYGF